LQGRIEAVLNEPSARLQAPDRPPGADDIEVDIGAVASHDVT